MGKDNSELNICFHSHCMQTLLDPTLPSRHGGAEVRTYVTASELACNPGCRVSLMVDSIPEGSDPSPGLEVLKYPMSPGDVRIRLVSSAVYPLRWARALKYPGNERERQLKALRANPTVNALGVIPGHTPRREIALRRMLAIRSAGEWHLTWTAVGVQTYQVVRYSSLVGRRSAIWLSSDLDVDWARKDRDEERTRLYRWALQHADRVFCQHSGQQRALSAIGVRSEILATGFPVPRPSEMPRDTVLWVASCQRLKQPELFIELARRLPDVSFTMVMTPREQSYFDTIAGAAAEVQNLHLIPGVPDVAPYYERAIALVNMSRVEGFPNTFIESALAGTPIVSLNVDPDHMLSRGAGSCCHGDFNAMVGQIRRLANDAGTQRRMGAAARSYAEANHDIRKVAAKLRESLTGEAAHGVPSNKAASMRP